MITMKLKSRGEDVKILQAALNEAGFDCGTADGIFGAKTEAAVKKYQKANKLDSDGFAGAKTCKALNIYDAVSKAQQGDYSDCKIDCPNIKQQSKPHGPKVYGPNSSYSTYSNGGCGPTSITTVIRAYYDKDVAVETIGDYCVKGGYRPKGNGTSGGAINYVMKKYGGHASTTSGKANILKALTEGHLVVLLIKKGFGNTYAGSGF